MISLKGSDFIKLNTYTNPVPLADDATATFAFYIRTGNPLPDIDAFNQLKPNQRKYLTREEYRQKYSVSLSDVSAVKSFAADHNLKYLSMNQLSGQILFTGSIKDWNNALSIQLTAYDAVQLKSVIGYDGYMMLPESLEDIVVAIANQSFGLNPAGHLKKMVSMPASTEPSCMKHSYFAPEVGKLYNFPTNEKGKGQTIGILEFPGGYSEKDLDQYYKQIGLQNPPKLSKILVNKDPNSKAMATTEVETNLDIQVATSLATESEYVVYLNAGLGGAQDYDGILNALFDEHNSVDVLSISYGGCELLTFPMLIGLYNQAMKIASLLGVTVCVSSGDGASPTRWAQALGGQMVSVNAPAVCSYALACGGTYTGSKNGVVSEETVWNYLNIAREGSVGGVSMIMDRPAYQQNTDIPDNANCFKVREGRAVPDVAANAAPSSGFKIIVNGKETVIGGTSAAAPLWAALIAILNSALGYNLGFVNNLLYEDLKGEGLVSIVNGNNGAYQAREGWDACTGWGRPDGTALLNALKKLMD